MIWVSFCTKTLTYADFHFLLLYMITIHEHYIWMDVLPLA